MSKNWDDATIISWMVQTTGFKNGFVTRDDNNMPVTYESEEDDGFVFALIWEDENDFMDYFKLQ